MTIPIRILMGLIGLMGPMLMAATNELVLTWAQPPGYGSTLYTATNVGGTWTALASNAPPYSVTATQSVAFFYVMVAPTNTVNEPVLYVTDPNSEGLKPIYTNKPDYAYSLDGAKPMWFWNPQTQQWQ